MKGEGLPLVIRTPPCAMCGYSTIMEVNRKEWEAWKKGAFIQDAFPLLSPDEREMILSGTHPECWDKLFSEDER